MVKSRVEWPAWQLGKPVEETRVGQETNRSNMRHANTSALTVMQPSSCRWQRHPREDTPLEAANSPTSTTSRNICCMIVNVRSAVRVLRCITANKL